MDIWTIFVVFLVAGILVFLVRRAPFIDAEWKSYISYGVLLVVVVWLISALLGGRPGNIHLPRG